VTIATGEDAEGFQGADDLFDHNPLLGLDAVLAPLLPCERLPTSPFVGRCTPCVAMLDALIAPISCDERVGMRRDRAALIERKVMLASFARTHIEHPSPMHGDLRL